MLPALAAPPRRPAEAGEAGLVAEAVGDVRAPGAQRVRSKTTADASDEGADRARADRVLEPRAEASRNGRITHAYDDARAYMRCACATYIANLLYVPKTCTLANCTFPVCCTQAQRI